jgi:hypothetical protein
MQTLPVAILYQPSPSKAPRSDRPWRVIDLSGIALSLVRRRRLRCLALPRVPPPRPLSPHGAPRRRLYYFHAIMGSSSDRGVVPYWTIALPNWIASSSLFYCHTPCGGRVAGRTIRIAQTECPRALQVANVGARAFVTVLGLGQLHYPENLTKVCGRACVIPCPRNPPLGNC